MKYFTFVGLLSVTNAFLRWFTGKQEFGSSSSPELSDSSSDSQQGPSDDSWSLPTSSPTASVESGPSSQSADLHLVDDFEHERTNVHLHLVDNDKEEVPDMQQTEEVMGAEPKEEVSLPLMHAISVNNDHETTIKGMTKKLKTQKHGIKELKVKSFKLKQALKDEEKKHVIDKDHYETKISELRAEIKDLREKERLLLSERRKFTRYNRAVSKTEAKKATDAKELAAELQRVQADRDHLLLANMKLHQQIDALMKENETQSVYLQGILSKQSETITLLDDMIKQAQSTVGL